ncbi:hypothetical protein C8R46DRAFT_1042274 [Mycena filopes]|nr:hypothetical protein C8R46DRAFT_1042274 [Mycena filopes]
MPSQMTFRQVDFDNTRAHLTTLTNTLEALAQGANIPYLQPIARTARSLCKMMETIKQNRRHCFQLMTQTEQLLKTIIMMHLESEELTPSMLNQLGKFTKTLYKIHAFVEACNLAPSAAAPAGTLQPVVRSPSEPRRITMEPTARASPRAEGRGKELLLRNFIPSSETSNHEDAARASAARVLSSSFGSFCHSDLWEPAWKAECCARGIRCAHSPASLETFHDPNGTIRARYSSRDQTSLRYRPIKFLGLRYGLGGGGRRTAALGCYGRLYKVGRERWNSSMSLHKDPGNAPNTARKDSLRSQQPPQAPSNNNSSSRSSNMSSRATTPTAASSSRSVTAGKTAAPSSGSAAPRLPSHMREQSRRAPMKAAAVVEVDDEGDVRPQASATYVSEKPPASPPSGAAPAAANEGDANDKVDASFTTTSELTPGSSVETSQQGSPRHLGLDNESVTAALLKRAVASPEAERFFSGAGRSLLLFKESLPESVERYHNPYDPTSNTDEDPLLYYGAVGGELPGYDSASSLLLREVVMRYQYPHKSFDWSRMSDLIDTVASKDAAEVLVMPTANMPAGSRGFALNLADLSHVAQAVVGVQQILSALNAFLLKNPARSFDVDPGFALVYLLEFSDTTADLRFALTSLQLRLQRADVHIRSYLSSIRLTITGDGFSSRVSSTDSTLSEVRDEYGGSHPRKELYRLVARPDYGRRAAIISSYAREEAVNLLNEPGRDSYYKKRDREARPTMKEKGKEREDYVAAPLSSQASAANAAAPSSSSFGVRFAAPNSPPPSVARQSAVGSLPGAGIIRDTLSASTAGGPSVTRPISTKGILAVSQSDVANSLPPPGQSWTTYTYKAHDAATFPLRGEVCLAEAVSLS